MTHLVIGAGEVGRAIAAVLLSRYDVALKDVEPLAVETVGALHICFPYAPGFEDAVRAYQAEYRADLTIIHSTVPVGTSRRLGAVHSPVTGRHPNLEPSVRAFTKFFGGRDAAHAADIFSRCGVPVRVVPDAETTEAGKLWQTLQHGWLVALQKEAYRFCEAAGADPDVAYREMNRAYNAGYAAIGEPWVLPVLRPMPGPIGGHCVIPNARLTPGVVAETLLELDDSWR